MTNQISEDLWIDQTQIMTKTVLDNSYNDDAESRLSIHEVPEQISRIFFGKPEVSKYFVYWGDISQTH